MLMSFWMNIIVEFYIILCLPHNFTIDVKFRTSSLLPNQIRYWCPKVYTVFPFRKQNLKIFTSTEIIQSCISRFRGLSYLWKWIHICLLLLEHFTITITEMCMQLVKLRLGTTIHSKQATFFNNSSSWAQFLCLLICAIWRKIAVHFSG